MRVPSRCATVGLSVTKNCDEFVCGPAFAIESVPSLSWRSANVFFWCVFAPPRRRTGTRKKARRATATIDDRRFAAITSLGVLRPRGEIDPSVTEILLCETEGRSMDRERRAATARSRSIDTRLKKSTAR